MPTETAGLWSLQARAEAHWRPAPHMRPHTSLMGAMDRRCALPDQESHAATAEGCAASATLSSPPAPWLHRGRSNAQPHPQFSKLGPLPTDPLAGLWTAAGDRQPSHETCYLFREHASQAAPAVALGLVQVRRRTRDQASRQRL